jgi:hypothetical protein
MKNTTVFGLIIYLGSALSLSALEPVACLDAGEINVSTVVEHVNGYTTTVIVDVDTEELINDRVFHFFNCATGDNIEARLDLSAANSQELTLAVMDATGEFVFSEPYAGMGTLIQKLSEHGVEVVELEISSSQNCACAAFYPELLGDKQPYEVVQ